MPEHNHISQQIKKYLNGELDARAMHELERRVQDDPFLMDALEGYQNQPVDINAGLADLHNRLQQRTTKPQPRIVPWRTMGIAASILLLLGFGLFMYSNRNPVPPKQRDVALTPPPEQMAAPVVDKQKADLPTDSIASKGTNNKLAANRPIHKPSSVAFAPPVVKADQEAAAPPKASVLQPASADIASAPIKDSMPLNEMVVMDYTAMKKNNELAKQKEISTQTYNLSPSSVAKASAFIKKDTSTFAAPVTRIGGTDIAKLNDAQAQYSRTPTLNEVIAAHPASDYKVTEAEPINQATVTRGYGNGASAIFGRRQQGTTTMAPLNPTIKHGRLINGMVKDKDLGQPVPYATVKIKGTTISTLTDTKGKFTLYAVPDSALLQISAKDYSDTETKANKRDLQVIGLEADDTPNGDVVYSKVAVGYNTDGYRSYPAVDRLDFDAYLRKNALSPDGKSGIVKVSFVVNPDNSISNFKIIKGLSTQTDNAAIKLIKDGPAWINPSADKPETVTISIKFRARGK